MIIPMTTKTILETMINSFFNEEYKEDLKLMDKISGIVNNSSFFEINEENT
jgi:hypothetical protein